MTKYPPNELLASARRERGWSQDDLAERMHAAAEELGERGVRVSGPDVGRWEQGRRWPGPLYVRLLCKVFDATAGELGLVKRREFLKLGALAGLATANGGFEAASFLLDRGLRSPTPVEIENLRQVTAELGSWYWRLSPSTLAPLISGHQSNLLGQLPRSGGRGDRDLRLLAAQTGMLAGMVAYRQHDYGMARRHLDGAEQLAREAEDGPVLASVWTARRAIITAAPGGGPRGAAARQAVTLLDAADSVAGRGAHPVLRVWLLCCRAEDAAALGREADAFRDLDEATTELASVAGPELGFFDHWDEARVDGWRASVLLHLRRPKDAAEVLEGVVAATPYDLPGPRTAVVADLGAAHAARGEPDHAVQLLVEALQTARQARIDDGIARVIRIRDNYLERYAEMQSVQELDGALEAVR